MSIEAEGEPQADDRAMDELLDKLERSARARHQLAADQSSTVATLTVAVTAAIRLLSKRDPDFGPGFIQLFTALTTGLRSQQKFSEDVLMMLKVAAGQTDD